MDKETAVALERLKAAQAQTDKTVTELKKDHDEWNKLLKRVVVKTVAGLILMLGSGALFGWQLPEGFRAALIEWASK